MERPAEVNKFAKLSTLLDKVLARHDSYSASIVSQIEVVEDSLRECLKSADSKRESEILEDLSTELLKKRPLSKMEEQSKGFYKYISKLGRDVDKLQQVRARDLRLYDIDFDHKSLKEAIGEYLLHQVLRLDHSPESLEQLKTVVDELGLISHKELARRFATLCNIREVLAALGRKDLEPLRKWIGKHWAKLKKEKSSLGFNFLVLKAYRALFECGRSVSEALEEIRAETKIVRDSKKKSLQKLFGSLVFLRQNASVGGPGVWVDAVSGSAGVVEALNRRYG